MKKCLLLFICILLLLSGCAPSKFSADFFAMDTVMSITAYDKDVTADAKALITELDNKLSVTNELSQVSVANAGKTPDSETLALIKKSLEISALTDGAFDITMQSASDLWDFGGKNHIPTQAELDSVLKNTGYQKISVDENSLDLGGTKIGLGAIAKGYSASRLRKLLIKKGVTSAVASLGGNVLVVGTKPNGDNWNVGIAHPKHPDSLIATLSVADTAVVTSGGYERNFEKDGVIYHHILNPTTATPANSGILSATVISTDDTLADALSTAVFVMGVEKATELYKKTGTQMLIVTDDTVYVTDNIASSVTVTDSSYTTKIIKA